MNVEGIKQFKARHFTPFAEGMNLRPVRERVLLLVTGWAILFALWDTLLYTPLATARAQMAVQHRTVEAEYQAFTKQIESTQALLRIDPKVALKQELEHMKQDVALLDQRLNRMTSHFIPPHRMAGVLKEMLEATPNLTFVHLRNLPAEPISSSSKQGATLYRHGMEVKFIGQFFSTMYYLKMLEGLPSKLMWDSMEYVVDDYPNATIKLVVRTLSEETGFIGT